MRKFLVMSLIAATALGATACGDDDDKKTPADMAVTVDMTVTDMPVTDMPETDMSPDLAPDMEEESIYDRLGKRANIKVVITAFVGRVLADDKINGYFLNNTLDAAKLIDCLTDQVSQVTGGPEVYGCRSMKVAHAGMGISTLDYNDLAGHLVAELTARGVDAADINTIAGVLTDPAFVADIVEDPTNDKTIYQRLGRKDKIGVALTAFAGRVLMDPSLKDYFDATKLTDGNPNRLFTCLTSQVCDVTGGPCEYGKETPLGANVCKSMAASHAGMTDTMGKVVTISEFNALVGHLVAELTARGVDAADIMAIGAALGPTCRDIVSGGTGCP